jgi:hypothetical protein
MGGEFTKILHVLALFHGASPALANAFVRICGFLVYK